MSQPAPPETIDDLRSCFRGSDAEFVAFIHRVTNGLRIAMLVDGAWYIYATYPEAA